MPNNALRAIEPALTADEWESRAKTIRIGETDEVYVGLTRMAGSYGLYGGSIWTGRHERQPVRESGPIHPVAMYAALALANAALPDDDPRKITHDDVVMLLEFAAAQHHFGLKRLGEKLDSLLPPDVTTYYQVEPET